MFACKNVCLLGFALLSIRKEGRVSVVICVCVYWRGMASRLGRARALRLRPVDMFAQRFVTEHENISLQLAAPLSIRDENHLTLPLSGVFVGQTFVLGT